jgi:hypothetical protein
MNLTLKLKTFQEKELIKDVENDDNNDENLIEVNDRVKNNDCV